MALQLLPPNPPSAIVVNTINELTRKAFRDELPRADYSASIDLDAATGSIFIITANTVAAFTINAPKNGIAPQPIKIVIKNTSGGALGAITWNAVFKKTAFTNPANGFSRAIEFFYDGTNWVQLWQSTVDVPN